MESMSPPIRPIDVPWRRNLKKGICHVMLNNLILSVFLEVIQSEKCLNTYDKVQFPVLNPS
jgi:hypothetical protein